MCVWNLVFDIMEQMVNVMDNNVQTHFEISCLGDAVCFPFLEFVMLNMQTAVKSFDWLQFPRKIMKRVLNMPCTLHP